MSRANRDADTSRYPAPVATGVFLPVSYITLRNAGRNVTPESAAFVTFAGSLRSQICGFLNIGANPWNDVQAIEKNGYLLIFNSKNNVQNRFLKKLGTVYA
ncbi:hypothetical protein WJ968_13555 [Achromobacter xylosoxidans]